MRPRPIPAPEPPPARRLPGRALPPYRYVPGLHPHPFRHAEGHLYTDGSAPEEAPWIPGTPWTEDTEWLWGLDLFDQRYWWEAHEAWEAIWHQVPRGSPFGELLQGLVQVCAALLKAHLGSQAAAERLLGRASERLVRVVAAGPEHARGLDLEAALVGWREAVLAGGEPPSLTSG